MIEPRLTGPKRLGPYPDRELDCQEALEARFVALVDEAEAIGWVRTEVYTGLIELIINHMAGDEARDHVFEAIKRLRRR